MITTCGEVIHVRFQYGHHAATLKFSIRQLQLLPMYPFRFNERCLQYSRAQDNVGSTLQPFDAITEEDLGLILCITYMQVYYTTSWHIFTVVGVLLN